MFWVRYLYVWQNGLEDDAGQQQQTAIDQELRRTTKTPSMLSFLHLREHQLSLLPSEHVHLQEHAASVQ